MTTIGTPSILVTETINLYMTTQHFILRTTLPTLNQYINAERSSKYYAASLKRTATHGLWAELMAHKPVLVTAPVSIAYSWYRRDRKTDKDNIAATGMKFVQDALIKANVIPNDGWSNIDNFTHQWHVDPIDPRLELTVIEREQT